MVCKPHILLPLWTWSHTPHTFTQILWKACRPLHIFVYECTYSLKKIRPSSIRLETIKCEYGSHECNQHKTTSSPPLKVKNTAFKEAIERRRESFSEITISNCHITANTFWSVNKKLCLLLLTWAVCLNANWGWKQKSTASFVLLYKICCQFWCS